MLHRVRVAAYHSSSNRSRKPVIIGSKKRSQKILKTSRTVNSKQTHNNGTSYFIRIFFSGAAILVLILGVVFVKQIFSKSLDLNNSQTFLVAQRLDTDGPVRTKSIFVVSLRGSDKGVVYSSLADAPANVEKYFPIDYEIIVPSDFKLDDKTSLLALFAPWNRTIYSSLSFYNRLEIWKYLLAIDSAHVQQQSLSAEPAKLLLTVQKYYSDIRIRQLAPTIAVVNTTAQNGLAKQVGDILNAWGYTVIQVDSKADHPEDHSRLVTDLTMARSPSVRRLKLALPQLNVTQDESIMRFYRSQFVLFIGNDYLELDQGSSIQP